jgi:hypothetical protein
MTGDFLFIDLYKTETVLEGEEENEITQSGIEQQIKKATDIILVLSSSDLYFLSNPVRKHFFYLV